MRAIRRLVSVSVMAALSLPVLCAADEPDLQSMMEHLRPPASGAEFQYTETRKLELMDAPWQGAGFLFSGTDGSLVKLQLAPERVLMAISGGTLFYYDPVRGRRHSAPLANAGSMQAEIQAFKSLLQGRADELKSLYNLEQTHAAKSWSLKLTARPERSADAVAAVEISGEESGTAQTIRIREADGDASEYAISRTADAKNTDATIQRLLKEAAGL